jgi:hypothetical protein
VAETKMRDGWAATVERDEAQLTTLGQYRPSAVVQAEIATVQVAGDIWSRTKKCSDATLPDSRAACAPVFALRQELAAAQEAERLESRVAAGRSQLAAAPVVGSATDPQAAALARLTGASQPTVRTALALLLAGLVEAGSALGFTILAAATMRNAPHSEQTSADRGAAAPTTRRTTQIARNRLQSPTPPSGTQDLVRRWALTRHDVVPGSAMPAREDYADFAQYARQHGHARLSETRFGRAFSVECRKLGGDKQKRRDRTYYLGFAVAGAALPHDHSGSERGGLLRHVPGRAGHCCRLRKQMATTL